MNSGLTATNPVLEAAFKTALLNQGIIALLIFATLAIAWVACRELLPLRIKARLPALQAALPDEPAGRKLLRIGFGALWVFDGILQGQPAMPGGLPSRVIAPASAGSPGWLRDVVNWAGTGWSFHPVQAAASVVWIQLGIGVWLIASAHGPWSRVAGAAAAGWGLVVWVFGEALGGTFAPGASFLNGAPGAALFYIAAGALIALPPGWWQDRRLGRRVLQACGALLAGFAVLQAWPGRGFWQGSSHGHLGSLAAMVTSMAGTSQPAALGHAVASFGSFVTDHGFAVNLVAVLVLASVGAGLLTGRPVFVRPAIVIAVPFFLADWALVQDFGFFGGLGTDPNSMIPLTLLVLAGYLALTRTPAASAVPIPLAADDPSAGNPSTGEPSAGGMSRRLRIALGTASASVVVALWAGGVIVLGAAPMAVAEANRTADPIIATALNGPSTALNTPAAAFNLTDQAGRQVSLASLRGKVVLLTFLDPVCTSDCPLIAQEFRQADQLLGSNAADVALVAIVANPLYRSIADTQAFDRQELLTGLRNWLFLTGTPAQLSQTWHDYYVTAQLNAPGAMALHPDLAYVIDGRGIARAELNMDPGPGTASSQSSFAVELAHAAERVMDSS